MAYKILIRRREFPIQHDFSTCFSLLDRVAKVSKFLQIPPRDLWFPVIFLLQLRARRLRISHHSAQEKWEIIFRMQKDPLTLIFFLLICDFLRFIVGTRLLILSVVRFIGLHFLAKQEHKIKWRSINQWSVSSILSPIDFHQKHSNNNTACRNFLYFCDIATLSYTSWDRSKH